MNWFLIPDLHLRNIGITYQNKEQETSSRFPVYDSLFPINNFEVSETFTQNCKIGNRESGTGNRKLVPYFGIYYTFVSKVQIGYKEPVPGSLLTMIGFILVSGFFYFINM